MINKERIKPLNRKSVKEGKWVVYWMQASQRVECNHALEYAVEKANELKKPLVVFFGITSRFPEAGERHYYFMLEGLQDVEISLNKRGIRMVLVPVSPEKGVVKLSQDACLVVVDAGYLKIQKKWRTEAAKRLDCLLLQVETDVLVPVEEASVKEEYSAATLRPKIHTKLYQYLFPLKKKPVHFPSLHLPFDSLDISDISKILHLLKIDRGVPKVESFHGGASHALKHLDNFLKIKLGHYDKFRNDPTQDYLSLMSPYLRFGQISPLDIALSVMKTDKPDSQVYLEELIVRRELAMNFTYYNPVYESFQCLPEWAQKTLREHGRDKRQYVYSLETMEQGKTHDPIWNAAQEEMMITGKMHGSMRMYWGKKILEWSEEPEQAFAIALYLNNKYELDGSDPNGYTGVAWCFGKYDRPWFERPIFGKVRYMNANGLKRKFNVPAYIEKIKKLKSTNPETFMILS